MHTREEMRWVIGAIAMRASGVSISYIAEFNHKDRQTVRHHLMKYDIKPLTPLQEKRGWGMKKKEFEEKHPRQQPVLSGKYDYLFSDLWDNRCLGE